MSETAATAPGTPQNPAIVKPEANLMTLANTLGPWATVVLLVGYWMVGKEQVEKSDTACHCAAATPAEKPAVVTQPALPPALTADDLKKVMDRLDSLQTAVDALKKK